MDGDGSCDCLGSPSSESDTPFREQVMSILKKPYDRKEHQRLSGDMKARKPIVRNKDLRFGRAQSFVTNKDGKSYLDHFPGNLTLFQVPRLYLAYISFILTCWLLLHCSDILFILMSYKTDEQCYGFARKVNCFFG